MSERELQYITDGSKWCVRATLLEKLLCRLGWHTKWAWWIDWKQAEKEKKSVYKYMKKRCIFCGKLLNGRGKKWEFAKNVMEKGSPVKK